MVEKTTNYRTDDIRKHLINSLSKKSHEIRSRVKIQHNEFIYFDKPINIKNGRCRHKIDRYGRGALYGQNDIFEIPWSLVPGTILIKALNLIKNNEVYFFKKIDNKTYKTRLKPKSEK